MKYSEMTFEQRSIDLRRTKEYAFTYMLENMKDYCDTSDDEEIKRHIEEQVEIFIENDPMFDDCETDYKSDDNFKNELVDYLFSEYIEFYKE